MAVSKIANVIPKYKDFTNVATDSNGFVATGLANVVPLYCTNLGGVLGGAQQVQFTVSAVDGTIGVRFMTWNGASAITGNVSFRLHYL